MARLQEEAILISIKFCLHKDSQQNPTTIRCLRKHNNVAHPQSHLYDQNDQVHPVRTLHYISRVQKSNMKSLKYNLN